MAPINQVERRRTFFNFLLFFAITVGIIVTTLLFSFQVPFKDNERMRKTMNSIENEKLFIEAFEVRLQETMNLLDSVNLVANAYSFENRIDNNLRAMTDMNNESTTVKNLFNKVIDNLKNMQLAKEQIREINKNIAESEKKDKRIEQLESQLDLCKTKVFQLQTSK